MDYPAIISVGLGYSKGDFVMPWIIDTLTIDNTDGGFRKFGLANRRKWRVSQDFLTGAVQGIRMAKYLSSSLRVFSIRVFKTAFAIGYTYSWKSHSGRNFVFMSLLRPQSLKIALQFGAQLHGKRAIWACDGCYHTELAVGPTSGPLLKSNTW